MQQLNERCAEQQVSRAVAGVQDLYITSLMICAGPISEAEAELGQGYEQP